MKPLTIVILLAAVGATDLSIAQNKQEEVHAACAGKAVGAAASWQREPSAYYGGIRIQSKGKMRLDVHRITLQKS